jgi:hypothetical protein
VTEGDTPIEPAELASMLCNVDHVLRGAQTSLLAFAAPAYVDRLGREHERLKWARSEIAAWLKRLPPEPPLTPEREAQLGRLIGAVLDKRFGDGSDDAIASAWDDLGNGP